MPVLTDGLVEGDETFTVVIAGVSGGDVTIGNGTGTGTIVDADAVSTINPAITVSNGTIYEGDDGQRRAQFFVHLSRPPATNVTITYTTADGTRRHPRTTWRSSPARSPSPPVRSPRPSTSW